MSVLPKESIKVLAEQSGISNVSDEVAAALVSDVEYRLREIIQVYLPFTTRERAQQCNTQWLAFMACCRNRSSS
jgi:transcription initiation factor TFIID subunit 6